MPAIFIAKFEKYCTNKKSLFFTGQNEAHEKMKDRMVFLSSISVCFKMETDQGIELFQCFRDLLFMLFQTRL